MDKDTTQQTPDDQSGSKGTQSGKEPDKIIEECRDRMQKCIEFEGDNRAAALDDLYFLSGEQWPVNIRRARNLDNRPCLTVNTLPTYLHQVTNDQRMNKGGIKVHPVDDYADVETAEVIQGLIRHIEYDSNADIAYDRAVNSAAAIGFGYFRLVTEYTSEDSFEQDIKFKSIRNAMTVYFDPASEEPDGSDAKFCIISVKIPKEEFRMEYPNADMAGFEAVAGQGDFSDWIDDLFVRVAEYYYIDYEAATVCLLSNGESGYKDELGKLPIGVTVIKERAGTRCKVKWCKLTGFEILESADIPGKYVPVFPVYGDELDIEGKVIRSGLIRNAKDPARMYNFWMTSATEEVSLRPKAPFIGAEGQFEGHEDTWAQANNRSFAYLEYKPVTIDGTIAPAPRRQEPADVPTGMLAMAMHAGENIQKTIGIFDAGIGRRSNETSGIAIRERKQESDVGSFHYTDNLNRTRKHAGRVIVSWLPEVYDTQRAVRILGEDGTAKHAIVNQPNVEGKPDKAGKIHAVLNDLTVGKYDVTVSSGPAYSTLRQEAAQFMVGAMQAAKDPAAAAVLTYLAIQNQDVPGGEKAARMLKKLLPPQVLETEDENPDEGAMVPTPQGPLPVQQAGQLIQQMGQALQNADKAIEQAKLDEVENKKREIQIKEREADIKAYEAQTDRMRADADLMKAAAEKAMAEAQALSASGHVEAVSQAAAREAVELTLTAAEEQAESHAMEQQMEMSGQLPVDPQNPHLVGAPGGIGAV
ncbi:MAG: portal protein [Sterolibacterium sp.]